MNDLNIMLAGFGGQGILFAGKVLAYSGLLDGREVSWIPSYGPEMRGGTAYCSVRIASEAIGSPLVTEPDVLVAFNKPALDNFIDQVKPGGLVLFDSSTITAEVNRTDIDYVGIEANKLAEDNALQGLANVIMIGKLLQLTDFSTMEQVKKAIDKSVSSRHMDLLEHNKEALALGFSQD